MPSSQHEDKIEEISREIKSRSMDWRTKKNYLVWLQKENKFGMVDIVGFKKQTPTSRAIVEGYEIEERNSSSQISRNFEKLQQLKKSFSSDVVVHVCQLKSNQNHKDPRVCPRRFYGGLL